MKKEKIFFSQSIDNNGIFFKVSPIDDMGGILCRSKGIAKEIIDLYNDLPYSWDAFQERFEMLAFHDAPEEVDHFRYAIERLRKEV